MADNQEQLYNEFADLSALELQKKEVLGIFDDIKKGIKELSESGIRIDQSKGLKGLSAAQKEQEKLLAKLEIATKKLAEAEAKLAVEKEKTSRARKKQSDEEIAETLRLREQNKERQQRIKLQQAEEGSITQLSLKLDKARAIYDKLGEAQRNSTRGKELLKFIQDTSKAFDEQRASTDRFQQRVGNYVGSAKIIVDAFERSRIKLQQVEQQFGAVSPEAKAARGEFEALERITGQPQFLNISAKVGDATAEVKYFTKALIELEQRGQGNSKSAEELRQRLAKLTDEITDTKQEIKALSSDSRSFDLFAGSVSFIADSYQAAAGAAVLFGASEEEAQAATRDLVAIQSVANGVKGIANELTTKGTAANKVFTFVQRQVNIAMAEGIVTANGLKASLGLLGIAATVIGAIVIGYAALSKSSSAAAINQKNLNEALKEAGSEYAKAVEQVNSLRNNVELAKKGFVSKTEVVKQYNESMGKVTGQAKDLNDVEQQLNKNADAYIAFTFAKATATAALAKAAELATQQQLNLLQGPDREKENLLNILSFGTKKQDAKKAIEQEFKKQQDSLGKQIDALFDFAKRKQQEAAEKAKASGFNFFGTAGDKDKNKNDDKAKSVLEANKIELEAAADLQRQIVEIESFSFAERQKALKQFIALKSKIIDDEAAFEKNKKGLSAEELNLIETKRLDSLRKLNDEAIRLFTITAKDEVATVMETMDELPAEVVAVFEKMNADLEEQFRKTFKPLTEEQKKLIQETKDNYIDLGQTVADTFDDVIGGIFDRDKNRIQDQIDEIEKLKAAEIERINASGDGEEKKAARVKLIEAKAQADREALEKKQRAIDRQRAIAERAFKLFQITTDTIQAVNKIKMLIAAAPDPISKAFYGSQLLQAIIAGGASVVSLLATPIPKFAGGKKVDDPYEGPGIAGEAGRELKISRSGQVSLFTQPTLTNLVKGDTILPNKVTEDVLAAISLTNLAKLNGVHIENAGNSQEEIVKELKQLNKRSRIIIHNQAGIESSAWFDYHFKH